MKHSRRLAFLVPLLLSGMLAAQQRAEQTSQRRTVPQLTAQQMNANVLAAAQRLADCSRANDLACFRAMLDQTRLPPPVDVRELDIDPREGRIIGLEFTEEDSFRLTEVAEPWPPIALDGVIFIFVPTFSTFGVARLGLRADMAGYLIGVSEDGGESWRFVPVSGHPQTRPDAVDHLMPGYGDGPRPGALRVYIEESPFASSEWLRTAERHIALADEGYVYALKFEIRKRIWDPIDVTIRYENPADRGQYFLFRGSLNPGQSELLWRSPMLNFDSGETYNVVIEGSDGDTGELMFEHRESLLFQPTRELWLSVMSKPPDEQTN